MKHFYACHADWVKHSGMAPTIRDGQPFRPVAQLKTETQTCEFCGRTTTGVFRYEVLRWPRKGTDGYKVEYCTDTDPNHVHDEGGCCECGALNHCCGGCPVFTPHDPNRPIPIYPDE